MKKHLSQNVCFYRLQYYIYNYILFCTRFSDPESLQFEVLDNIMQSYHVAGLKWMSFVVIFRNCLEEHLYYSFGNISDIMKMK